MSRKRHWSYMSLLPLIIYPDNVAPEEVEDDDDPVIAEYDVYITPEMAEQIYLLQFPNRSREQPYNERTNAKPLELRVKPESGFMEMDISTTAYVNFDKTKGLKWGEALNTAKENGATAFGIASGFGKGTTSETGFPSRLRAPRGERNIENQHAAFEEAELAGKVLNKQTLGGQIIKPEPGMPHYMLGAFRGSESSLADIHQCPVTY
jgi:DNA-directed RNA polymerase III subunit RPC5